MQTAHISTTDLVSWNDSVSLAKSSPSTGSLQRPSPEIHTIPNEETAGLPVVVQPSAAESEVTENDACQGRGPSTPAEQVVREDAGLDAAVAEEGLEVSSVSASPTSLQQNTAVPGQLESSTPNQCSPVQPTTSTSTPMQATAATASTTQQRLHDGELDTETAAVTISDEQASDSSSSSRASEGSASLVSFSRSSTGDNVQPPLPLVVHVYRDVGTWLGWLTQCMYHTEVHYAGEEWTFTGEQGICRDPIGTFKPPRSAKYITSFEWWVSVPRPAWAGLMDLEINIKYQQSNYGMFQRNCNHFSRDFCWVLAGVEQPKWINRPARTITNLFGLAYFCPPPPSPALTPPPPQNTPQQPRASHTCLAPTPTPTNLSPYLPPPLVLRGAVPAPASQHPSTAPPSPPCPPHATATSAGDDAQPASGSPPYPHHSTSPVVYETASSNQQTALQSETPVSPPLTPDPSASAAPPPHKSTSRHRPKWLKKCVNAVAKFLCLPRPGNVKAEAR